MRIREEGTTCGHKRTFWHDVSVLYLDWNGGYQVYICQNSSNCIFKMCILLHVISIKLIKEVKNEKRRKEGNVAP